MPSTHTYPNVIHFSRSLSLFCYALDASYVSRRARVPEVMNAVTSMTSDRVISRLTPFTFLPLASSDDFVLTS